MTRPFIPVLLLLLLLGGLLPREAWAQKAAAGRAAASLPKLSAEVDKLAAQARENGMTVIVMTPGAPPPAPVAMVDTMRAERFLAARARVSEILASAGTLGPAMAETLARIEAAAGGWWWLARALLTAMFGAFVGWLVLRPAVRASGRWASARAAVRAARGHHPRTGADRAMTVLSKTAFATVFAVTVYAVALLVAVIFDSDFEPTRRVIFECLTAFLTYRLLRHAFSWPLTAYDDAPHRMTGFDDGEARSMHRGFSLWVAVVLVPMAGLRFFITEGPAPAAGGAPYGALTSDHVALLTLVAAALGTFAVVAFALLHRREASRMFMPRAADGAEGAGSGLLWRIRCGVAGALPWIVGLYGVVSLLAFLFRLGLGLPAPGAVVLAPFVIFYVAFITFCLALVVIRAVYGLRERRWREGQARERAAAAARLAEDRARLADDEDMVTSADVPGSSADVPGGSADEGLKGADEGLEEADVPPPEYRPILRGFFERAAFATIATVALGELGRWWGVPVGEEGNWWAAALDIVLAVALAVIAYGAITAAIDRRLEEEGGTPEMDEEQMGAITGEGGGAGASRLATLLPILRWVLVAVVFVAAAIAVLSRFGVDIGPLLASAGVVGIAVGFGAQKLIQDVFSGAFFLLDDAFRRGEYIEVEGTKGTVEKISIRSFQLRHHLGALHTLPFGEIRQLTNYSRDWVLMKLPLRVTYDTDVEKVRKLVKRLGQELLDHPEVGHTFLQPLKSQGVYKMEDSAMIIRVKFMTLPGEQFVTRKVVYAAIQELFARENIRFAHKEVTVRLADGEADDLTPAQRQAVASAAREVVDAEGAEAMAQRQAAE